MNFSEEISQSLWMAMRMKMAWGVRVGNKTKQENTLLDLAIVVLLIFFLNNEIQPLGVPTLIIAASYFRISPGSPVST